MTTDARPHYKQEGGEKSFFLLYFAHESRHIQFAFDIAYALDHTLESVCGLARGKE